MKHYMHIVLLLAASGCSYMPEIPFIGAGEAPSEPTIASLEPVALERDEQALPPLTLAELAENYRRVLAVAEDPSMQMQVRRRLADLEMLAREEEDTTGDGIPVSYTEVIAVYDQLLREYPDAEGSDQLLYQMARAQDMNGDNARAVALMEQLSQQYPQSGHLAEAEFRKGEAYFSAGNYRAAEQSYSRSLAAAAAPDYRASSLYMLGWARFKQGNERAAVDAFLDSLDKLMPADNDLEMLSRGDREMAADCFRVLAVIFDHRGGSRAIAATFAEQGTRNYEHLVYEALGDLYLSQERYQDSADTYAGFIAINRFSPAAHKFHWRIVEVYQQGGFPAAVIDTKADYVEEYSVSGEYWRRVDQAQRDAIAPRLQQYIDELARYHHAAAQELAEADKPAESEFLAAAAYYSRYITSFPALDDVPDKAFLLGEAREAGGDYRGAIEIYQWMVQTYPEHPRVAEAAYASLLAYNGLEPLVAEDRSALIDRQLYFAHHFPGDERAPAVLANAIGSMMDAAMYSRAVVAARELVDWQPDPGPAVIVPGWLQLGHAQFELAAYAGAERAYLEALQRMPAGDSRRGATVDQLGASIYRQGELAVAEGSYLAAAEHFSRVVSLAADSSARSSAQYDAANSYRLAGDYERANAMLLDFRQRYPGHELTAGIGAILVENYETTGDWDAAASELDRMRSTSEDLELQREALYLAADYYRRAGDTATALARYRSYAHTFVEPLPPRLEAMLTLADIYREQGEAAKRAYWLEAIASAHEEAGVNATDRSRYLAASAMSELADDYRAAFEAVTLDHPLEQSLARKRVAMDDAVTAYERVNSYGLQEYGTRATYNLGEIYRTFSVDLMNSERPAALDAQVLEQYELLLEEQAWPFEEKAMAIHETNARRAWDGLYDQWIEQSFAALARLMPVRWGKREAEVALSREIR